jgi:hypothetical protein
MKNLFFKVRQKILYWFVSPITPPSYEEKRSILLKYKGQFDLDILVETGTFLGDTVEYFKKMFKKVISIELAEDLAARAQKRFQSDENVSIIQGDSGILLKSIVDQSEKPILFWLDGHYSSEFYIGDEYIKTAKASINTPIEAELKSILSSNIDHVILIDDARLFSGLNDYPSVGELKRIVRKYKKRYFFKIENDIIHIIPQS